MNLIFNKRGNAINDSITWLVFIGIFVIVILIGAVTFGELNDDIQDDDEMSQDNKDIVSTQYNRYTDLFDGGFLFVFCLLWVLVLVASYSIDTHPIFFVITLILLTFVIIISAFIGNMYEEFASDDTISSVVPSFPMMNWILTHLVIVIVGIAFSIMLVLFAKQQKGY